MVLNTTLQMSLWVVLHTCGGIYKCFRLNQNKHHEVLSFCKPLLTTFTRASQGLMSSLVFALCDSKNMHSLPKFFSINDVRAFKTEVEQTCTLHLYNVLCVVNVHVPSYRCFHVKWVIYYVLLSTVSTVSNGTVYVCISHEMTLMPVWCWLES